MRVGRHFGLRADGRQTTKDAAIIFLRLLLSSCGGTEDFQKTRLESILQSPKFRVLLPVKLLTAIGCIGSILSALSIRYPTSSGQRSASIAAADAEEVHLFCLHRTECLRSISQQDQ